MGQLFDARLRRLAVVACLIAPAAACASRVEFTQDYTPVRVRDLGVSLNVGEFRYEPGNDAGQFQLSGNSLHTYRLKTPVNAYVREAFLSELSASNAEVARESPCEIKATISDLGLQDVGFVATYTSQITYVVEHAKKPKASVTITSDFTTSKGALVGDGLNEVLFRNFRSLFDGAAFTKDLQTYCRNAGVEASPRLS